MALISKRNFKTTLGDTDLELEAKSGQGLIVKDIKIFYPLTNYITVSIAKTTVGYFRVGGALGSHLSFPLGRSEHSHDLTTGSTPIAAAGNGALLENAGGVEQSEVRISESVVDTTYSRIPNLAEGGHHNLYTILSLLGDRGLFKGFPISSGEKFVITGAKQVGAIQMVEYEIWEEPDIIPEMENGSKSSTYLYINYGATSGPLNVATDVVLTVPNNPAEFPDFPFAAPVPAGRNIELHGILASDVKPLAATDTVYTVTQFLKFMQGKTFLFDQDRQGLLYYAPLLESPGDVDIIAEGFSVGGNFSDVDLLLPFFFDPPIVFPQGQELTVAWKCAKLGAGSEISVALQEVGLILKMIPAA